MTAESAQSLRLAAGLLIPVAFVLAACGDSASRSEAAPSSVTATAPAEDPATVPPGSRPSSPETPAAPVETAPTTSRYMHAQEIQDALAAQGVVCDDPDHDGEYTNCDLVGSVPVPGVKARWYVFTDDTVEVLDRTWAELSANWADCENTIIGDHWALRVDGGGEANVAVLVDVLGGEVGTGTESC